MKSLKRTAFALLFLASSIAAAQSGSAVIYCTPKTNSLGCVPAIGFTGLPSASATSGFTVTAVRIHNARRGLLVYGFDGRLATPFFGGTLCVRPRIYRTPQQNSRGSFPPAMDCKGSYSIDMNAFAAGKLGGHPQFALTEPGTTVNCQYWNREESSPFGAGLTDAVEYTIGV